MTTVKKNLKVCVNGHKYYKTSDCPVCPVCEQQRPQGDDFFAGLSAPARRALENAGITNVVELSKFSKKELLALHGLGPASLPLLNEKLKAEGLTLKG